MKSIALAIIVTLFSTTCLAQELDHLVGAWNWESTTTAEGVVTTPQSTQSNLQIQFNADGTFIKFSDFQELETGQWDTCDIWVMYFGHLVSFTSLNTTLGDQWHGFSCHFMWSLELRSGPVETPTIEMYSFIAPTPTDTSTWGQMKAIFR